MSAASRLRVRAYAPYPGTGPSTRFRLLQFAEPLARRGVDLEIVPFLDEDEYRGLYEPGAGLRKVGLLVRGLWRRFGALEAAGDADVVIVQRELAPVLNGALLSRLTSEGAPVVYDFDDAVFLRPEGGSRLLGLFRRPKAATAAFCRDAVRVLAGNRYLADFAREARDVGGSGADGPAEGRPGGPAADDAVRVLPTVVDTDRFAPGEASSAPESPSAGSPSPPVVGWIGTHSTARYLVELYPALRRLADRVPYRLLVVSNRPPPPAPGVEMEYRAWSGADEVEHVRALDVGLYPLSDGPWARGKCGFKAIQYLACGVPAVASPVGVLPDIVVPGETGYLAADHDEWVGRLERLLADPRHRDELGRRGRERVVDAYSVSAVAGTLEAVLREAGPADGESRTASGPPTDRSG